MPALPQSSNVVCHLTSFLAATLGIPLFICDQTLYFDDPGHRNVGCSDTLKTDLSLPPQSATMDTFTHQRRRITRSCSLEETVSRSSFYSSSGDVKPPASYIPQSKDQNGNFSEKDVDGQKAKSLQELSTDEVCQWFTRIGLPKYLPFIREAKLCGANMASIDLNMLDVLHISSLEDREKLLSAIYNELHPPSTITRTLDSLLETLGPNHVETFTATLASMSKSKSSPHVSCLSLNRRSLRNNNHNYAVPRNPQLIEITINASERIVHLRTPTETTVAKVMDSCLKMLGMTEDRTLFSLRLHKDAAVELSQDQQIGSLLTAPSDITQLELHLCKMEKASSNTAPKRAQADTTNENINIQPAKEERIRELNQQVDSLQNVILQVQELHLSLVAFCSEIKNMDVDVNLEKLSADELKQKLQALKSRLSEKRRMMLSLRDNTNNSNSHKEKQMDVRLLEKMKMNCQVFKEEITMVHLNRQIAHLQTALQENSIKEKAPKKTPAIGSLSQLVSPQSPAMMFVVEESQGPDGCYGFTCRYTEGSGLVVVKAEESHLCVDDRLVEVNGVQVINSTEEDLNKLLQVPTAQIVVLRQPPPPMTLRLPPALRHHLTDPLQKQRPERDDIATETPSQRKLMAI
ncbi:uncharacterized protein ACB058_011184 [Synchiropus picturatus]